MAVRVNDTLISQRSFQDTLTSQSSGFASRSSRPVSHGGYSGKLETSINSQGRVLALLTGITLNGSPVPGELFLVQEGGQTMGFRNLFGLAPIPIASQYLFGGFANLNILQPTAGREALSRDSIQHVANLVTMIEAEVSADVADSPAADMNTRFQQYIHSHGRVELARNVTVTVLPSREDVPLGKLKEFQSAKQMHYYAGRDQTTLQRFASEQSNLIYISQANPRRSLQVGYIQNLLGIPQVPEKTIVDQIQATELSIEAAMLLLRIRSVLLEDYLMSNVEVTFAKMSHGVTFHVEKAGNIVRIYIARSTSAVETVVECYRTARDVFEGFVKDFVREGQLPFFQVGKMSPSASSRNFNPPNRCIITLEEIKRLFKGLRLNSPI